MKVTSVSSVLLIILISALFLNAAYAPNNAAQSASQGGLRRFGFGFVNIGALQVDGYSASTFFKAMFLTPPYPSTVELLMNNGIREITSIGNQQYLLSLMQMASPYPNIKLGLHVAFDVSNSTQWSQFQTFLNMLAASQYKSSLGFVGFAVEQLDVVTASQNSTWQQVAFSQMQSRLAGAGFQFVSYFPQGLTPGSWSSAYLFLSHTNYPASDNAGNLNLGVGQANIVGITHGLDGWQVFPSVGCSNLGFTVNQPLPGWSTVSFLNGYLPNTTPPPHLLGCDNIVSTSGFPPTIDQALSMDNSNLLANRQWDFFIAGNSGNDYSIGNTTPVNFVGVSGLPTHLLWDNPTFRQEMSNWLASNSNTFVTSVGGASSTTSTTSSRSATLTSTIISSTTKMSTSTIAIKSSETHPVTSTTVTSETQASTSSSPSMTLNLLQSYGTALPGGSASSIAQVSLQGNWGQPVVLTAYDGVAGLNVTFSPSQSYQSFESTMSIEVPRYVAPGVYPITVEASFMGLTKTTTFTLSVSPALVSYTVQLSVSPSIGGTTGPSPGVHNYVPGSPVTFAALPAGNWSFDHWDMNGTVFSTSQLLTFTLDHNNTLLTAVFVYSPNNSSQTATVSFLSQGYSGGTINVDGSNFSLPTSFTWPLGSSHNITAYSVSTTNSRLDFLGWGNNPTSDNGSMRLTINQSMFVVANYLESVLTRLYFVDSSGSPLAVQNATLLGPSGSFNVKTDQAVWLTSGSRYALLSANYMGVDVAPVDSAADVVVASSLRSAVLPLLVYGAQVKVVDVFGMPLQGIRVDVTTLSGQVMNATTDSQGEARFGGVPLGIYTGHITYLGISYGISQYSQGENSLTVTIELSYPIAAAVLVVAAVSFYVVLRKVRRNSHHDHFEPLFYFDG